MRFSELKQDRGVAGLTILLSLVVMLFVIGLLVMIFVLMGSELRTSTYTSLTSVEVVNESITAPNTAGINLTTGNSARDGVCGTVVLLNATGDLDISSANYTQTSCSIVNLTGEFVEYDTVLASYNYTWSADNTATDVMNDTTNSLSDVTDWFSIFIVIGAMVVLILLTVIIITAIRGSGMIQGGATQGGNVGSA